jgi:hypothetical protein
MTSQQYIDLRNHLIGLACIVPHFTPEYQNLWRRIRVAHDKAYEQEMKELQSFLFSLKNTEVKENAKIRQENKK